MQEMTDKLGASIKIARLEKHLTQRQLADRLLISSRYLREIENSRRKPSYALLKRILQELDISLDAIFTNLFLR